jgi:hypothetical protein
MRPCHGGEGNFCLWIARYYRIVGIIGPFKPAAIVICGGPAQQVGIESVEAGTPSRAAVEVQFLFRTEPFTFPVFLYFCISPKPLEIC